jgi:hypothetical protein
MRTPATTIVAAALLTVGCGASQAQTPVATAPPPPPPRQEQPREAEVANTGGIVIEGQLGHLTQAQLNAVLGPATQQLAGCYNDRLAEHPYLAGHIELKIRIGADGVPLWVAPVNSTLGDRPTEQCMIERAMALRFPRPRGGETETTFPLDLEGGEDARPATPWPPSRVDRVVGQHRAELQQCMQGATGPFDVTLYAARGGTVSTAGVSFASNAGASVADCLVRQVSGWRVPDPGSWYAKTTIHLP